MDKYAIHITQTCEVLLISPILTIVRRPARTKASSAKSATSFPPSTRLSLTPSSSAVAAMYFVPCLLISRASTTRNAILASRTVLAAFVTRRDVSKNSPKLDNSQKKCKNTMASVSLPKTRISFYLMMMMNNFCRIQFYTVDYVLISTHS